MNFVDMASIQRSDAFFWYLAVPVMAVRLPRVLRICWKKTVDGYAQVVVPLFLWADILNLARYIKRRVLVGKVRTKHTKGARKRRPGPGIAQQSLAGK